MTAASFLEGQSLGSFIFALIYALIAFLVAKKAKYFTLPANSTPDYVTFVQTLVAFILYVALAFLVLPFILGFITSLMGMNIKALPDTWSNWAQILFLFIIFGFLVLYCFMIDKNAREEIFWRNGEKSWRRFVKTFAVGAVTWLISYPFILLMNLIASWLADWIFGKSGVQQVAVNSLKKTLGHPVMFGFMVFAVVILVPFMEELLFRGFLQSYLRRYLGRIWALIVVAAIFAGVHFSRSQGSGNFQLILSLFVLSLFLGFVYERERTLWAPIGLHATFNAISVLLIFLQHSTS